MVISPGEELHLLKFASDADYAQFMQSPKVPEMRVRYCSVLDECRAMDERRMNPVLQIQEVRSCPLDPAVDFKQ